MSVFPYFKSWWSSWIWHVCTFVACVYLMVKSSWWCFNYAKRACWIFYQTVSDCTQADVQMLQWMSLKWDLKGVAFCFCFFYKSIYNLEHVFVYELMCMVILTYLYMILILQAVSWVGNEAGSIKVLGIHTLQLVTRQRQQRGTSVVTRQNWPFCSRVCAEAPRDNLTELRIDCMIGGLSERGEAGESLPWCLLALIFAEWTSIEGCDPEEFIFHSSSILSFFFYQHTIRIWSI